MKTAAESNVQAAAQSSPATPTNGPDGFVYPAHGTPGGSGVFVSPPTASGAASPAKLQLDAPHEELQLPLTDLKTMLELPAKHEAEIKNLKEGYEKQLSDLQERIKQQAAKHELDATAMRKQFEGQIGQLESKIANDKAEQNKIVMQKNEMIVQQEKELASHDQTISRQEAELARAVALLKAQQELTAQLQGQIHTDQQQNLKAVHALEAAMAAHQKDVAQLRQANEQMLAQIQSHPVALKKTHDDAFAAGKDEGRRIGRAASIR